MKNARKRKNARAAICKAKRATGSSGVFPLGAHFCFHAEAPAVLHFMVDKVALTPYHFKRSRRGACAPAFRVWSAGQVQEGE